MSYCKESGKDTVIFATEEDLSEPSKAIIYDEEDVEDQPPGLILPNGDINWDCPCLGGMATGPCGVEFREAFSCFHYSEAEPKGSDCYEAFLTMQNCMGNYPEVYPPSKPDMEEESSIPAEMGIAGDEDLNSNNEDSPGLISVLTSNSEEEGNVDGVESKS